MLSYMRLTLCALVLRRGCDVPGLLFVLHVAQGLEGFAAVGVVGVVGVARPRVGRPAQSVDDEEELLASFVKTLSSSLLPDITIGTLQLVFGIQFCSVGDPIQNHAELDLLSA
jgi:hypothetical protein